MSRETMEEKAARLIADRKVSYSESVAEGHLFTVVGDTGESTLALNGDEEPF